jgi:hypothetical protein
MSARGGHIGSPDLFVAGYCDDGRCELNKHPTKVEFACPSRDADNALVGRTGRSIQPKLEFSLPFEIEAFASQPAPFHAGPLDSLGPAPSESDRWPNPTYRPAARGLDLFGIATGPAGAPGQMRPARARARAYNAAPSNRSCPGCRWPPDGLPRWRLP